MFSSEGDSGDIFGPTGELLQLIDDDDEAAAIERALPPSKRRLQPASSSSGDSNPHELVSSRVPGCGGGDGSRRTSTKSFDPLSEYSEFAVDNDCRSDISDLVNCSHLQGDTFH